MPCNRIGSTPFDHSPSFCQMMELSTTWVNRAAAQMRSPLLAASAIAHSASFFEAAYTSPL